MEILQQHKTDMKLHDEIIHLPDHYLTTGKLNPMDPNFSSRKKFIQKVERAFATTGFQPYTSTSPWKMVLKPPFPFLTLSL